MNNYGQVGDGTSGNIRTTPVKVIGPAGVTAIAAGGEHSLALGSLGADVNRNSYILAARILFGLIGGGGGVIWLPGTGPVPVDPEPFRVWSALSADKRDVLVGLALSEMANLVDDEKSREEIKTAGLKLLKNAAS